MIEQTATASQEYAPCSDPVELLRALRQAGKHSRDPIGFHYLEAMASRVGSQRGSVRNILQEKLMLATLAFLEEDSAAQSLNLQTDQSPATQGRESLRGLVEALSQNYVPTESALTPVRISEQPELKSIQYFRSTWSKLSIDRQVAHAFAQAPKNAGPLNSHVVALRSLTLMLDISPDYLNRFLGYVDTLARLDQSTTATGANRKPATGTGVGRKKSARR